MTGTVHRPLELAVSLGLDDRVTPYYGVDQGDAERVAAIADAEFGSEPLDVVIDDASHLYGPTRTSFEVLFPRLRPGGVFVIEDWTWQDVFADNLASGLESGSIQITSPMEDRIGEVLRERAPREIPLSMLGIEAVLARARGGEIIERVEFDEDWITIVRGPGSVEGRLRLDDLFVDHYRVLNAR